MIKKLKQQNIVEEEEKNLSFLIHEKNLNYIQRKLDEANISLAEEMDRSEKTSVCIET